MTGKYGHGALHESVHYDTVSPDSQFSGKDFCLERMSETHIFIACGDYSFHLEVYRGMLLWTPQGVTWEELEKRLEASKLPRPGRPKKGKRKCNG